MRPNIIGNSEVVKSLVLAYTQASHLTFFLQVMCICIMYTQISSSYNETLYEVTEAAAPTSSLQLQYSQHYKVSSDVTSEADNNVPYNNSILIHDI